MDSEVTSVAWRSATVAINAVTKMRVFVIIADVRAWNDEHFLKDGGNGIYRFLYSETALLTKVGCTTKGSLA